MAMVSLAIVSFHWQSLFRPLLKFMLWILQLRRTALMRAREKLQSFVLRENVRELNVLPLQHGSHDILEHLWGNQNYSHADPEVPGGKVDVWHDWRGTNTIIRYCVRVCGGRAFSSPIRMPAAGCRDASGRGAVCHRNEGRVRARGSTLSVWRDSQREMGWGAKGAEPTLPNTGRRKREEEGGQRERRRERGKAYRGKAYCECELPVGQYEYARGKACEYPYSRIRVPVALIRWYLHDFRAIIPLYNINEVPVGISILMSTHMILLVPTDLSYPRVHSWYALERGGGTRPRGKMSHDFYDAHFPDSRLHIILSSDKPKPLVPRVGIVSEKAVEKLLPPEDGRTPSY
ncbi:hypothetical protein DFH07DRAFT_764666 [Mycena maculata]|uniref:Uncharacterized protein n=1 Tax=Mycena maculata TaxID=230809 RepID=A0AAD7KBS5_9AGAR|nr:hypothetical protein DFH07DRAFT_764666 [Mycena maculata]